METAGKSVRESFVRRFGEAEAKALEDAAAEHVNGINSENKGSDPFKWAVLIAVGYQCVEKPSYAEYHGIMVKPQDFKQWCMEDGELASHDGDCDYLALLAGAYNDYVVRRKNDEEAP